MLRVGITSFINSIPFVAPYELGVKKAPFEYVLAPPKKLHHLITEGELDVSFVSAIFALQNKDFLHIVDGIGIGGDGKVDSVNFFVPKSNASLEVVYLDTQSLTSNILLQWLIQNTFNVQPTYQFPGDVKGKPHLLIGDACLERGNPEEYHIYDLATWWKEKTDLPFLFAPFVSTVSDTDEIKNELLWALKWSLSHIDELAALCPKYPLEMLRNYWDTLVLETDARFLKALHTFEHIVNEEIAHVV